MKAGKYNIKELFVNRYVQQIIIPEIQRDYVWSEKQVIGLLDSIKTDYIRFKDASAPSIDSSDVELTKVFDEFYKRRNFSSNIGFIYAYNDEQYSGKYFLIDGQQRITTIYLILLVLASKDEELKKKFFANYLIGENLKLDYKVREASHNFINDFLKGVLNNITDFKNQNWYFVNLYDSDTTIKNWLNNFNIISNYIESNFNSEVIDFYNYLENQIDFWYFDTNISQQGEELYIYMNARGEQMQSNENIKADLLGKLETKEEKNRYGKLWEDWQDFFWKHRGKNENADKGFNQFLSCIAGLEYYLNSNKSKIYTKEEFEKTGEVLSADVISVLSFEKIEEYYDALIYLFENQDKFSYSHQYSKWVSKGLEVFWSLINDSAINWFANYEDDNRATERRFMVYVWSILHFITQRKVLQLEEVFRLLRIYYLRFNNNIRAVTTLKSEVNLQVTSGIWKESTFSDERLKHNLLNKCKIEQRDTIEELIWQIEDHPFNLNGQDVGNINISHLVNFNDEVTVDKLKLIKNKFFEVFPENDKKYHAVKHILLYYGNYYDLSSPYYYLNLKFDNWRRIIRGIGSYLKEGQNPFYSFFSDFIKFEGSLEEFIKFKDKDKVNKTNLNDLKDMVLWYSQNLGEKMWDEGGAIAISLGNPCSLPDWQSKDVNFPTSFIIYNTKGDLKGGNPIQLNNLIN